MSSWHQSALTVLERRESPYFFLDFSVMGVDDIECCYQNLSQQEKLHANSLLVGKDLYVATRSSLRIILEQTFGITPKIESDDLGKPYATNIACKFNVSHSANAALIVLGGLVPVGADLEFIKKIPDMMSVANIALNAREKIIFSESGCKDEVFYQLWVRKEAALKALGFGITDNLGDYCVEERPHHQLTLQKEGKGREMNVSIVDLPIEAGYIGALASTKSHMAFARIEIDVRHHLLKNPVFAGSN